MPTRESGSDPGNELPVSRLADVPLPSGGYVLIECNLLAWGLVGCRAGDIDRHFAFWEAGVAAGLTDGPGLAHVVYRTDGAPLGGGWIDARADGTGRTHLVVDPPRHGPAVEVIVDLTSDPASQRLRRILDSGETGHRWQPARNALLAASAGLVPRRQELIAIERLVMERIGADADGSAPISAGVCEEISKQVGKLRHELAIDAPQAAGLLLAAQVPIACAAQHPGDTALAELVRRRYLVAAAEHARHGFEVMARLLVMHAVRDGYAKVLDYAAATYYTRAIGMRDAALDGPPDPLRFAAQLYDAPPYAYAAYLICQGARAALGKSAPGGWARMQTDAEELFIRIGDGIYSQYRDWCLSQLDGERQKIAAAQARGDRREVWKLIRNGEFALRWPRSYRPYLLGKAAAPAVDYPEGDRYWNLTSPSSL